MRIAKTASEFWQFFWKKPFPVSKLPIIPQPKRQTLWRVCEALLTRLSQVLSAEAAGFSVILLNSKTLLEVERFEKLRDFLKVERFETLWRRRRFSSLPLASANSTYYSYTEKAHYSYTEKTQCEKIKLRDRLAGADQVCRSQEIVVMNCRSSRRFSSFSGE